jgi:uncharacterized protein YndB with AHSA1/START domain
MDEARVSMPSDKEVQVTRSFKSPKATVYRAYTEPVLIRRWLLGPPGWTMPVCEMDVRVGGSYRWRWRNNDDGKEFGLFGVFKKVEPGVQIVQTQTYDPGTVGGSMGDGETTITVTFAEAGGVTTMTTLMAYNSKASRDAAVATGMTRGMEQGYVLLDKLLSSTANEPSRATAP